jgi:hypothetical protein
LTRAPTWRTRSACWVADRRPRIALFHSNFSSHTWNPPGTASSIHCAGGGGTPTPSKGKHSRAHGMMSSWHG